MPLIGLDLADEDRNSATCFWPVSGAANGLRAREERDGYLIFRITVGRRGLFSRTMGRGTLNNNRKTTNICVQA